MEDLSSPVFKESTSCCFAVVGSRDLLVGDFKIAFLGEEDGVASVKLRETI